MIDKLTEIERRYDELTQLLSDPDVIANQDSWQKYAKAQAGMTEIVEAFREYKSVLKSLEDTESLLSEKLDPELKEMAELEREELISKRGSLKLG